MVVQGRVSMYPSSSIMSHHRFCLENLRDPDPEVRYAEAKARFGKVRDRPEIIAALSDALAAESSTRVRVQLAMTLGSSRSDEAVAPLVQVLQSEDPDDRIGALYGLRFTRQPAALACIMQVLQDPAPAVRSAAVSRLRGWCLKERHPAIEEAVAGLLKTEPDEGVREVAQRALLWMQQPRAPEGTCLSDYL